ncbi:MAG: LysE family transporter [Alphaproteobacteria bacterium]|nr:LysE family transporter [Alphaproteobacteria bacterium]
MDGFLLNWFLLIGIFTMALASPGPDFVIAVRNSILYSRKIGIITAIGFALGVSVHMTYTLLGLAVLISQSVILFNLIKYAGAAYLFYIGFNALKSRGFEETTSQRAQQKTMNPLRALWNGFLTNALNPKATLFFMAVFSQFINPETPFSIQIIYALTCVVMTGIWFSLVAMVLTHPKIKAKFLQLTKWIDRVCGGLLIALGIKLAFSKAI